MKDKRPSQNVHTNLALTDAISSRNPSVVDKSRKAVKSRLCGIFTFRMKSSEIVKIIRNGVKFGVKKLMGK